jgi:hypothetical protein
MNRCHDIEGELQLLPSEEGGRTKPVLSGMRPVHKLHDNYLSSGQHEFVGVAQAAPGETVSVLVWLVTPDVYPGCLWVGREIEVLEVPRVFAKLKITKVINPILLGTPEAYSPTWVEPQNLSAEGKRIDG